MLRKFQKEGMVKLSRGKVTILDKGKLEALRTQRPQELIGPHFPDKHVSADKRKEDIT